MQQSRAEGEEGTRTPEPGPAAPSGGAAVRGAGAEGGGTAAGRVGLRSGSVRAPEAAPARPSRPRPGFLANRYSASAERARSARTGRDARLNPPAPTLPPVPPKPSLLKLRLLKAAAPPRNSGSPIVLSESCNQGPKAGSEADAVWQLGTGGSKSPRPRAGGGGTGVALGLASSFQGKKRWGGIKPEKAFLQG